MSLLGRRRIRSDAALTTQETTPEDGAAPAPGAAGRARPPIWSGEPSCRIRATSHRCRDLLPPLGPWTVPERAQFERPEGGPLLDGWKADVDGAVFWAGLGAGELVVSGINVEAELTVAALGAGVRRVTGVVRALQEADAAGVLDDRSLHLALAVACQAVDRARMALMGREEAPLWVLVNDPSEAVRANLALNPYAPGEALVRLLTDASLIVSSHAYETLMATGKGDAWLYGRLREAKVPPPAAEMPQF